MFIKFKVINNNKKYIIAVSGGPDSMFLLDNIYSNKYLNINNFYVCTVNYLKRSDSYIDQNIVVNYCKKRYIKFFCLKVTDDIYAKYSKFSSNFQSIARDIRYDFFMKIALKNNCEAILVAHNLTDNIETYLLQKKRGGIVKHYGLNVISWYHSKFFDVNFKVLRIMLNVSRKEILSYLKLNNIEYANDYTNDLLIYNRNIVRKLLTNSKKIKYLLEEIKEKNIENNFLFKQVNYYFTNNYNIFNFDLIKFNCINNSILKKMIIYKYFEINNFLNLIVNKKHNFIDEVIKQFSSSKPNIIININDKYSLVKTYGLIKIIEKAYLNIETIIIDDNYIDKKFFKWKNYLFIISSKFEKYTFSCRIDQLPLIITNDYCKFNSIKFFGKSINRIFIKEKINVFDRLNYIVIDSSNNIVFLNSSLHAKLKKYYSNNCINISNINKYNSKDDKKNFVYFVIK